MGFLVGERINAPQATASPALSVLGAVRRDVTVIRRLLETRMGRVGAARAPRERQADAKRAADVAAAVVRRARATPSSSVERAAQAADRRVAEPRARDARGRFVRSERASAGGASRVEPATTATAGPVARSAAARAAAEQRAAVEAERDARGRFTGGGTSDYAGENVIGKIAGSLDSISEAVTGAENIDPTIAALKEVRDVVSPLGRGFMALQAKMAERKRERWYSRILKAITGRKSEQVAVGGAGDVSRGSFLGTFFGELMGNAARMLPAVLAGAGGLLLKGLGLLGAFGIGQYIGGKIYEWLDKSGIATKVFDAFDAVTQWFREKFDAAKTGARNAVRTATAAAAQAQLGSDEARYGLTPDDRREGRMGVRGSGGDSLAYKAGRVAGTIMRGVDTAGGGIKRLLGVDGKRRTYENVDGSIEQRDGGSVSWRNNNPGNLKFEFAGSADKTVRSRRTKAQALASAQQRYAGVVDLDQFGNAIFASEAHGRAAKAKLLMGTHGGLTVEQMLPKYAVSDYSGTANHAAYAAGIYRSAEAKGLNLRGKKIGDMTTAEVNALLDGMQRVEGFKVGTVSSIQAPRVPAVSAATVPSVRPGSVPVPVPEKPAVVQAAPVPERLAGGERSPVVVVNKEDVGQDVRSRKVAHIVTGGVGG